MKQAHTTCYDETKGLNSYVELSSSTDEIFHEQKMFIHKFRRNQYVSIDTVIFNWKLQFHVHHGLKMNIPLTLRVISSSNIRG